MNKLNPVDAFRAQVLLDEALKKLSFLVSISGSASVHRDELTQFMGDEISRIIQEQRDLEHEYEELVAERGRLKGLANKARAKEIQIRIGQCATALRESNKSLCRNLKENPDVKGNLQKMQTERNTVQEWLEQTKLELMECSFESLIKEVDEEKKKQERLTIVKKNEREASQHVKLLEFELQREYADHEKETKAANLEIRELKEQLQKDKTISAIELTFEEKKLIAKENALLRVFTQKEKALREMEEQFTELNKLEEDVHHKAHDFLQKKVEELHDMQKEWSERHERDNAQRQAELEALHARRGVGFTDLEHLKRRLALEHEERKRQLNEQEDAVEVERQRKLQEQRMKDAITALQEEGRAYLERKKEWAAAAKGKKKKRGKKK